MAGSKEAPLTRGGGGSSLRSRIAMSVAVGIVLGCVLAFLFPDGLFRSNSPLKAHARLKLLQDNTGFSAFVHKI